LLCERPLLEALGEIKINIIYVFVILLLIIAITETVLSGTWNKYYFLHGIPIFSKEIEISNINKASEEIQNFIITLDTFPGFSKYKGTMFDENTFAFRKKIITVSFYRNDFENIHGTISINPESRNVEIKGYAGFSLLAFLLYFFVFFLSETENFVARIFPALFFIFIIGLISYAFDRRKYNKMLTEITELINK